MDARDTSTARAWVDVDLGALVANYDTLQQRAKPRVGMLPVVKADAYGLGMCPVVRALRPREPWGYGIAALSEGVEMREKGVDAPALHFFCTPQEMPDVAEASITPAIGDLEALERWRDLARERARRLPFHLEIDTGMGRCGFLHDTVSEWLPAVMDAADSDLDWEGTFTHFHSADVEDAEPTREQWERFRAAVGAFPRGSGGLLHTSASVAATRWPEFAADLLRPGLFLYGGRAGGEPLLPKSVVTVCARVATVRDVPAGWTASYGATHRAERPSRWATVAIGYGDGLRRELSNNGVVRFGEREAPIVGRVCMDVTVVDVTDLPEVKAGDVATVIGGPADSATGLTSVAERCGTISYEILTGLTQRLPRRYLADEAAAPRESEGPREG
ncbi:MAG: alanine racemase [Gemmatimonadetes bacterium]|uniref:Alanine racemase n=1 Tax=Candidatus Kutchimonas denitrificans TaxID=3056748 RepID=A0AAE4Z7S3_9BACT|nr:alanine racemase [Gemmatimonadota bacterium]NIR74563.1 alanine racemase [Candidatus Kutchimonas denitrificans]NIS02753.1 alanine racemase [Gemmatimonadota bacterium]NIT68914.1 alanine racemase [Gemmatimonadota bacterium]NIU52219.1 alanine racemase [Gemmatimonadota bacterium]